MRHGNCSLSGTRERPGAAAPETFRWGSNARRVIMLYEIERFLIRPECAAYSCGEDETIHFKMFLPGVRREAIDLRVFEDRFSLEAAVEGALYLGEYEFLLPVFPARTRAELRDDVLEIVFSVRDVEAEGVRIAVE